MYHWLCLLALVCLIQQLSGCPPACSCSLGHVDCSRRGLISVPRHLPSTTTSLDISGNDIERLISSSFFNATSVLSIDASDNRIRLIDPTLFIVLNLSVINLRKNRLTSVPCGFSALERLDLSANSVATLKEEDVRCLAAVRTVDLSRNRIGEIAVTHVKHSILQRLDLASNTIGSLPAGLFLPFPCLFSLRLSRNKISFIHRHAFKGLSRLESLELGRNHLSSVPTLVFEELTSLKHLHLFRNRLEGLEDGVFFGCHSLQSLNLTLNRIQNVTEGLLFGLNSLHTLDLSSNEISSIDPTVWGQTPSLRWLSLHNNQLSSLPSGAFRLLPMLQFLSLADNRIQSIHKTAMTGLNRLDSLDLSGNHLAMCVEDGAVLSNTSLSYLQSLFFARNDLKVIPSKAFSRFPNLKNLDLSENPVATLHEGAFEPLKLQKLSLQTSSLLCDCLVSWFPNWLYKTGLPRDPITAICSHPSPLKNIPVVNIDHENLTCVDDSPRARIVLHPVSTVAVEKSTTQFSCHGYGMEPIVIEWMKVEAGKARPLKENRFTSINTTRSNIFNNTMTGHEMVESVLQLETITLSDSGDYQCVVSNLFATVYSVRADLQVHQPPTFLIEPDDLSLLVGLNTRISCAATGIPTPTLRWSKDGGQAFPAATERRLHVKQGDDHLYILNVTSADQGVYTCHASNSVGSSQASATLRVYEHGFRSTIVDAKVSGGDTHIYECLADVAQQRIVWLKDGRPLETDGSRVLLKAFDQVMVISKVIENDAGQYDCELWAGGDVLTRQTAKLSVSTLLEVPSGAARIVRAEKTHRFSAVVVISCGIVLFVISGLVFSLIYWCRQRPSPVAV